MQDTLDEARDQIVQVRTGAVSLSVAMNVSAPQRKCIYLYLS